MKFVLPLCILVLATACKKSGTKPIDKSHERMDLSEVLNTDDYFKNNKKASSQASDSIGREVQILEDINNDGFADTVVIKLNKLSHTYTIQFSCFKDVITEKNAAELYIKSVGDLNGDGIHEIMLLLQSEESCWDGVKLYSHKDKWVEKYDGLTYQCTDQNNYQFKKLNDKSVEFTTFGINKDSIDLNSGDTLENIIPNAPNRHIINW